MPPVTLPLELRWPRIVSGSSSPVVVLGFWAGVVLVWAWLAVTSLDLYRRTPLLTPAL